MDIPGHKVVAKKRILSHLAMFVTVEKRGRSKGGSGTIVSVNGR